MQRAFVLRRRQAGKECLIQGLHVSRNINRTGHQDSSVDEEVRRCGHTQTLQPLLFGVDLLGTAHGIIKRRKRRCREPAFAPELLKNLVVAPMSRMLEEGT